MSDMALMTWLSSSSNVWNTTADGTERWHSVECRVNVSMASSGSVVRMKLGKSLRRMPLGNPSAQSIIVLSKYPFLSCPASACFYSDYYFI